MDANQVRAKQGGAAQRRKMHPRSANPYVRGTVLFDLWDEAWTVEDDWLNAVRAKAISDLSK
jgi:hypothetical protein